MATCTLCWKRTTYLEDASQLHIEVCRGCRYEVERVVNYLNAHKVLVTPTGELLGKLPEVEGREVLQEGKPRSRPRRKDLSSGSRMPLEAPLTPPVA